MNIASLELCKELYELSGWGKELQFPDEIARKEAPRYGLGYLLRKLPPYYVVWGGDQDHWHYGKIEGPRFIRDLNELSCDTPENAACKLLIELFRQHILPNGLGREMFVEHE